MLLVQIFFVVGSWKCIDNIQVTNVVVENAYVQNTGDDGLVLWGSNLYPENVTFKDCTVRGYATWPLCVIVCAYVCVSTSLRDRS